MRLHPLLHCRLCHARMMPKMTEITVITATGWWYGNLVPRAFLHQGVGALSATEKSPGNEVRDTAVRMRLWWPHHGASPCLPCVIKFSTSDNAILAFSLVHFISVTSNCNCVWPYMETNTANVAQLKIVHGKFRRQKNGRKKNQADSVNYIEKKYKKLLTMPS